MYDTARKLKVSPESTTACLGFWPAQAVSPAVANTSLSRLFSKIMAFLYQCLRLTLNFDKKKNTLFQKSLLSLTEVYIHIISKHTVRGTGKEKLSICLRFCPLWKFCNSIITISTGEVKMSELRFSLGEQLLNHTEPS